jgi:hypothetical protein
MDFLHASNEGQRWAGRIPHRQKTHSTEVIGPLEVRFACDATAPLSVVIYVLREQREHDAVVSSPVGLAVSAEDAFALEARLLDHTD